MITHGMSHSAEYRAWQSMLRRCLYPSQVSYPYYGGKGIKVLPELSTFEGFFAALGPKPKGTTLDRIDSDGPYSRENVRWAEWKTQMSNRNFRHRARGVNHGCAKLNEADVLEIRRLGDSEIPHRHIAKMFGIGGSQALRIIHRESWRHL